MNNRSRPGRFLLAVVACVFALQPLTALAAQEKYPTREEAETRASGRARESAVSRRADVRSAGADDDIPGVPLGASPVTGSLNESSDPEDVYNIALTAGQRITFSITGPAGTDFGVELYGPGGWDDYRADAWGETYPYTASYVVPTGGNGTYYLDVYSFDGSGAYTLTYTITTADPDDYLPGVVLPASPVTGTLDEITDPEDYYFTSLNAADKIVLSLTGDASTLFAVVVFGPGGADDERAFGFSETYPTGCYYVVPPGKAGTYSVAVVALAGSGSYTLTYGVGAADPDDYIPGVALPPSPVTGSLDEAWDLEDIFAVPLVQGQRIHASLTATDVTDFDMALYKPGTTDTHSSEPVRYAADEDYPDVLVYTAPSAGTYYLDVIGYAGAGDYQLDYTIAMAPPKAYSSVAGPDRYQTAIAASKKAFPGGAPCVVIATGTNWPDALGGAALAGAKGGPILLTDPGSLTPAVKSEIVRLGAGEAIVLGSEAAIGKSVFTAVSKLVPAGKTTRIGGADRYSTADKVAAKAVAALGNDFDYSCFIATGLNFPDALGASPLAAALGRPILLASPKGLTSGTRSTMANLKIEDATIIGSEAAVSSSVFETLQEDGVWTKRIAGPNRYMTAAEIAEYGVFECGMTYDKVAIATGENFPDALAAGVMQGLDGSVMLLTPKNKLDSSAAAALKANKWQIDMVRFLGSTNAVSNTVRQQVKSALK